MVWCGPALRVILMVEFALLGGYMRGQGGAVPQIPVSAVPSAAPRVRAPLTVLNKPIVVEFRSTRSKKLTDSRMVVEAELRVMFYRDRDGKTRTDYFDSSSRGEGPAVSILWDPQGKAVTFVSFADRTVQVMVNPMSPSERDWMPAGPFVLKFTNDQRTIRELECKRVDILPIPGHTIEETKDEIWVALDWGIVMLDVTETAAEQLRWEVVRVERLAPEPSVFRVPEGFVVKRISD